MSATSSANTTAEAAAAAAAPPPPRQEPPTLIPSLPNDVALNILARVPRTHHPILSAVSKAFRSLLSSPIFYATRSLIPSSQESFLYLSVRIPSLSSLRWFTLHQNSPNPRKPRNFLTPLPPTPSPLVGSAIVGVGPKIYVIGGSVHDVPTSHVWALDCRLGTWEAVQSMRIAREFAAGGEVEGKIYVMGGCLVDTWARLKNWAEVYDPKKERWEAVESGKDGWMMREKWMHGSAVVKGRMYAMADRNGVVYDPKSKEWGLVEGELDLGWRGRACVVDGVVYCYDYLGKIRGFDMEEGCWRELRGVEKELPKFLCGATMACVGGKLVVVWEGKDGGGENEMEVWCAEIAVEKNPQGELWGKLGWCEVVHRLPFRSSIVHCLGITF